MQSHRFCFTKNFQVRFSLTLFAVLLAAANVAVSQSSAPSERQHSAVLSVTTEASSAASAGVSKTEHSRQAEIPKSKQPLATVGGIPIYDEDLPSSINGQLLALRNQEYEIKRKALDELIEQKLLEAAAKRRGISTEELVQQEVNSKVKEPSDTEINGYYLAVKERVKRPLADVRPQLKEAIQQAEIQQARQGFIERLRADSSITVLLSAPRVDVAFDPSRVRGNPKAPVMIVEFSDYQCPYCHAVEPTLKEVLAKYGDKVSLSYRDFPLSQIHANAQAAAEASRCAEEQGKFWEYHDRLFTAAKLDSDSLLEYARDLKLDDKQFSSCLTSGKYKAEVEKDLQEGRKAGVAGTPAFFINGSVASGAQQQETLIRMIDEELARKR